ncbi:MAG: hypothetical protein PWP74_994, partial [Shewanella sp.]|nr:hypothetical protein [Shewanella sp.]
MCSIFAILDIQSDASALRSVALEMSKLMRHRGPDWSGIFTSDNAILAHERLAIVDIEHGAQPLYSEDNSLVLAVNGEIYNHKELKAKLGDKYRYQTNSDCEVILALYQEYGCEFLDMLNGI